MRIWIVKIGEPLPIDSGAPRLLRSGILAEVLHARGHEVHWWTASFDHWAQRFRVPATTVTEVRPGFTLHLLQSCGFRRHVSLRRILDHREIAAEFRRLAPTMARPDVIVCAYPTIELADAAVAFGRRHGIPVMLDVRDLWPDIFTRALPAALRPLGRLALWPLARRARRAMAGATSVCAITATIRDWALAKADRVAGPLDIVVPHGYADRVVAPEAAERATAAWAARGVGPERGEALVPFIGTLSKTVAFAPVADAAGRLAAAGVRVRFVVCGTGSSETAIRALATDLPNVTFAGWIGADEIWTLMQWSVAGLVCYHSHFDFEASIPNKPIEYMAGGLPVVSSIQRGELRRLLESERCGLIYRTGDGAGLAAIVARLVADPAEARAMGQRARAVYEDRFRADAVYGRLCDHVVRLGAVATPEPRGYSPPGVVPASAGPGSARVNVGDPRT